jgi:hypothetical protein
MMNFKKFVGAIHDAILKANEALMDKNTDLLSKYFVETTVASIDNENKPILDGNGQPIQKTILEPISVIIDYPFVDDKGDLQKTEIHVPLITLVPLSTSQIEKAILKADFQMQIVDDELQLDFVYRNGSKSGLFKNSKGSKGSLEIVISPQDTSEGLKLLIEAYDTLLKKQIP